MKQSTRKIQISRVAAAAFFLSQILVFATAQVLPQIPPSGESGAPTQPSPAPTIIPSPLPSPPPPPPPPFPTALPPPATPPGTVPAPTAETLPTAPAPAPPGPPATVPPSTVPPATALPATSTSTRPPPPASSPIPASSGQITAEQQCLQTFPDAKPVLGGSPTRFVLTVFFSSASIGTASVLYSTASSWEIERELKAFRFICIVLARLLLIVSVKAAGALVATIANSDPGEAAIDISGALLTFASAIYVRIYYETFSINLTALGFYGDHAMWDRELREILSPTYSRDEGTLGLAEYEDDLHGEGVALDDSRHDERTGSSHLVRPVGLYRMLVGGRADRILLFTTMLLSAATEATNLILYTVEVVKAANVTDPAVPRFAAEGVADQCNIHGRFLQVMSGLGVVTAVYLLTDQQSLVPLLTLATGRHGTWRRRSLGALMVVAVLALWVISLAVLPLYEQVLTPFYLLGKLSLFGYVWVAPPSYTSLAYQLRLGFAIIAAVVGSVLAYRIRRECEHRLTKKAHDT